MELLISVRFAGRVTLLSFGLLLMWNACAVPLWANVVSGSSKTISSTFLPFVTLPMLLNAPDSMVLMPIGTVIFVILAIEAPSFTPGTLPFTVLNAFAATPTTL